MTANDYEQLGRVAYSLLNGAIVLSFLTVSGVCVYAWWRLFKWAMRLRS